MLDQRVILATHGIVNLIRRRTRGATIIRHAQVLVPVGSILVTVLANRHHGKSALGNKAFVGNLSREVRQVNVNMLRTSGRHVTSPRLSLSLARYYNTRSVNGPIRNTSMISPSALAASRAMPRTTSPSAVFAAALPLPSVPTQAPALIAPPAFTRTVPPMATVTDCPCAAR